MDSLLSISKFLNFSIKHKFSILTATNLALEQVVLGGRWKACFSQPIDRHVSKKSLCSLFFGVPGGHSRVSSMDDPGRTKVAHV